MFAEQYIVASVIKFKVTFVLVNASTSGNSSKTIVERVHSSFAARNETKSYID